MTKCDMTQRCNWMVSAIFKIQPSILSKEKFIPGEENTQGLKEWENCSNDNDHQSVLNYSAQPVTVKKVASIKSNKDKNRKVLKRFFFSQKKTLNVKMCCSTLCSNWWNAGQKHFPPHRYPHSTSNLSLIPIQTPN